MPLDRPRHAGPPPLRSRAVSHEPETPRAPPGRPQYKGEPLDADRGPGLGCFWTQAVVLAILLVVTPAGALNGWPIWLTGGLLALTLVLLFFTSLTIIFLLRLVAADRRARRAPLRAGTTKTVGQLEDEATEQTDPAAQR